MAVHMNHFNITLKIEGQKSGYAKHSALYTKGFKELLNPVNGLCGCSLHLCNLPKQDFVDAQGGKADLRSAGHQLYTKNPRGCNFRHFLLNNRKFR